MFSIKKKLLKFDYGISFVISLTILNYETFF